MDGERMKEFFVVLLNEYEEYALIISLLTNIIISILGVIPSVFITASNVTVFGFWDGMIISFLGETIGAMFSFWLYRKGFKKMVNRKFNGGKNIQLLLQANGKHAFFLILFLRLLPFIPSGLVTFFSAMGSVSFVIFTISSSLGKIPSVVLEAYSVYQITNWTLEGKLILIVASIFSIYLVIKRMKKVSK